MGPTLVERRKLPKIEGDIFMDEKCPYFHGTEGVVSMFEALKCWPNKQEQECHLCRWAPFTKKILI